MFREYTKKLRSYLFLTYLEFPEFLVNTVVPERHSRKRWGTPQGEQEGENPAFRAGKRQAFFTCEPPEGHRESIGAKGQWYALVKNICHCKANTLQRSLAKKSGDPCHIFIDKTVALIIK